MVMKNNKKQPTRIGVKKNKVDAHKEQEKSNKGKKIYEAILWLLGIVCWIFVSYIIIGAILKKQSLDKNAIRTQAIVLDNFYSIRYTDFFSYRFFVGDKEYQGSGWYYPESDTLAVGDTIFIYYDSTNPDSSRPEREFIR